MKIEKKQTGELELQVTLNISKEDYAESEQKRLKERRKVADIKGFRKGMAPMSLIQKLFGEQSLVEAVNEVISENLNNFVKENNLRMVGEPLTSEDQPQVEWKSGNDFVFKFDLGTTPEVNFEVSKEDKLPYYNINVTEEAKKEMKENMLRQFGSLQDGKKAKADDFVIVDFSNADKTTEGAYVSVDKVEGKAKDSFVGAKVGDEFDVNVNEAFTNETDRAAMLKVAKDQLASLNPEFHVVVKNIKTFVPAEENQETYDKMFGEGKVKSSEDFDAAVAENLTENYKQEADFRLSKDIRDYFVEKAAIALPENFLKRWLFQINEGKFTMEQIEKEFDAFLADFRWSMVRSFLMEKYSLKVEEKDMREAAQSFVSYQYAMYGMAGIPQQMIDEAAQRLLSDERQARQIYENVEGQKVVASVRENVTLQSKKISVEKFRELK